MDHKKLVFVLLLIFMFGAPYKNSFAQSLNEVESKGEELHLVTGNVVTFKVNELSKIAIGNPKIVDAISMSLEELALEPKMRGTTQLIYVDKEGEHKIFVRVLERDLDALKRGVDEIIRNTGLKGISSNINYEAQKVYITGDILNETERKRVIEALRPMSIDIIDMMVSQEQKIPIEIDVEVVEMNKNDVDDLGVKWALNPFTTITETPFKGGPIPPGMDSVARRVTEGFRIGYTSRNAADGGSGMKADINLLVQKGKAKILSRPKLVCLSGKEAEFLVGGEVPIVTITTNSDGTQTPNVEYKKYGVSLSIKPLIRENGEIELVVNTDVTDIDEVRSVSIPKVVEAPAFTTRNAKTELYLKDNETVFLAGLISKKQLITTQGMPFLGKVPILGWLFKNKNATDDQIELLISLTPHIKKLSYQQVPEESRITYAPVEPTAAVLPQDKVSLAAESLALREYGLFVQRAVADAIGVPQKGLDAKLVVALSVASDGSLKNVALKEASGDKAFDDAVIEAVKKRSPFPAFPPQLKQEEISLDIPIVFEKSRQG